MSVDLLRSRLSEDISRQIDDQAALLINQTQAPLDQLRFSQGIVAGLRIAGTLLEERYKNLHAIG